MSTVFYDDCDDDNDYSALREEATKAYIVSTGAVRMARPPAPGP